MLVIWFLNFLRGHSIEVDSQVDSSPTFSIVQANGIKENCEGGIIHFLKYNVFGKLCNHQQLFLVLVLTA